MRPYVKSFTWLFVLTMGLTGIAILVIDTVPGSDLGKTLSLFKTPVFGVHMFCWMTAGMIANYLWDLCKAGKTMDDIHLPDLMLPILVSPIVFFGIWSLWPDREIRFALHLVAFQNGFFWQVTLSKAGPVTKASDGG